MLGGKRSSFSLLLFFSNLKPRVCFSGLIKRKVHFQTIDGNTVIVGG